MNPLSQTVLQTRAFQSWRLVLMAVILLAAATTSGLYIGTIQAQGSRGAITVQAQSSRGAITGLTLSSDTPGTLTLSWDAASPTPTDYRVDWAKSDEDYQSWKVDKGHKYRARTATAATIADLEHDTEYRVRIRARYYRGEHESQPWGGPWAEATLQVKGNPQPEQAEEPPQPDQPPPAANVAKDKEPSLVRQTPMVTWTEIPHTGKAIDGKFYKHIEDTRFLMVWDADTETGPRLPAYEVQFAQCNSTANAAITYEHTEPVIDGLFKIRHRRTDSTTDPAPERAYPPTDNDRWQIHSGTECDRRPERHRLSNLEQPERHLPETPILQHPRSSHNHRLRQAGHNRNKPRPPIGHPPQNRPSARQQFCPRYRPRPGPRQTQHPLHLGRKQRSPPTIRH